MLQIDQRTQLNAEQLATEALLQYLYAHGVLVINLENRTLHPFAIAAVEYLIKGTEGNLRPINDRLFRLISAVGGIAWGLRQTFNQEMIAGLVESELSALGEGLDVKALSANLCGLLQDWICRIPTEAAPFQMTLVLDAVTAFARCLNSVDYTFPNPEQSTPWRILFQDEATAVFVMMTSDGMPSAVTITPRISIDDDELNSLILKHLHQRFPQRFYRLGIWKLEPSSQRQTAIVILQQFSNCRLK